MKVHKAILLFYLAFTGFSIWAQSGGPVTGDVNDSGITDVVDALLVARYSAGLPVTINTYLADVNCDQAVNITDALQIARYAAALIAELCSLPVPTPTPTSQGLTFVRAKGNILVTGRSDTHLFLRGVCFGNEVWSNPANPPLSHHNQTDFQRVKDMGMNVIRFYLNYRLFEEDSNPYVYKQSGWDWLDRNVSWARQHNIYLSLNIHVPQGGFQSNGGGLELWNDMENQNRLVSLWTAIAARYAEEPAVAAYDLLNEPVVTTGVEQWKNLAQRLVDAIRTVDTSHLIIIEQLLGVANDWTTYSDPAYKQFLVTDAGHNLMYDFHFYYPMDYTHQNTSWTSYGEGGAYPDETKISLPNDITYAGGIYTNPKIPAGTSDWTYYEGVKYQVTDAGFIAAKPTMLAHNVGSGTVYFDDFIVNEYNEAGQLVRTIFAHNIEPNSGFGFWTETGTGQYGTDSTTAHQGTYSLYLTGTQGNAVCYFNSLYLEPKLNYHYSISGWARSVNIPSGASCSFCIDFEKSPSGQPVYHRNKAYLEHELTSYLQFGITHQVPMNVGEFGLYRDCFLNDRNGIQWVRDMLDLLARYGLNFTYHTYHEQAFGIYYNNSGLPDPAQSNQALITLFTSTLN